LADTKISNLTTDSAPHRSNDFAPTYDASAVATKKVALKDFGVIELRAGVTNFAPADATTYYMGAFESVAPPTSGGSRRVYIRRAGIITGASIFVLTAGGTSETSTISVRLNNTTDTTITSSFATNATTVFTNTSLAIAVAVGDYVEIKWVTPTWVTNPTVWLDIRLTLE
jgi:hypothetical protein